MQGIQEILILAGLVTAEQVDECRQASVDGSTSLEQCLIDRNYTTAQAIAQALAASAGFSYLDAITDTMAEPLLLARVPLAFLRDHQVMPIKDSSGQLLIVTANPLRFQSLDELNLLLGGGAHYVVSTSKVILDALNRYYPIEGTKQMIAELEQEGDRELEQAMDFKDIEDKDVASMASEAPIIKLVNTMFLQAVKRGASDIHIEPFEKEVVVRYRIDGILYQIMTPPKRIQGALTSRIKIMAGMNIAEKRMPQGGRIDIRVSGRPIDIRVSVLPVAFGERVVMRLLDKSRTFGKLKDMDFLPADYKTIESTIHRPNGVIFITGPTGSGKTTTLYSILGELNNPEVNIVTVEDPVEYQMAGIGQVQVREKIGLTFAAALREILRQDPDIVMIGETRDNETAQIAIQASLTGHLVLSTLHTNSAPATITRLLDMGIEPYLIASSVVLAVAQRLVRKLCTECKEKDTPSHDLLASIGITPAQARGITFYKPVGCKECNNTGYRGRLAIFELMTMSPAMARLTMDRADTAALKNQAMLDGMTPLVADGARKVLQGLTTIDEVLSVAIIEQTQME